MKNHISALILLIGITVSVYAPQQADILPSLEGKENLIHVAIIGSGPSGLAAAIPASRSGYHTVLFQGPKPGGELMDAQVVENWPGLEKMTGHECIERLENQVISFGTAIAPVSVTEVDFSSWPYRLSLDDGTIANALTVVIATGASQKPLGIEGEQIYWGKGLFSCGMCDSSFTKGKETIVIGGGDIAIQRALQLVPTAKKITIVVPTPRMTAHESMQNKIKGMKQIKIILNKEVKKIAGDGNAITHVELFDPETKESSTLKTTSVFLSTGLTPNTELCKDQLPLDGHGCIKLKEGRGQDTIIEGVYAAGNVADPTYRQVAVIEGDGTKAGIDAVKQLAHWGFDGILKRTIQKKLYKPIPLHHPDIMELEKLEDFNKILQETTLPLLVEFYSPTCPSCRKMAGPLSAVAAKYKNKLSILKADKDIFVDLLETEDINMIPAFLLYVNGQEIKRMEGSTTREALNQFLEEAFSQQIQSGS